MQSTYSLSIAALVLAVSAHGDTLVFNDFSDTSLLTLNGATQAVTTADGVVLRMTPALGNQSGSAFSSQTVNAANFSTKFSLRITDPAGSIFDCNTEAGADGIVFVVQSVASDIGGGGGGIGYAGIANSVGVELDTWCNSANNDPSSNHVGIDTNGSLDHGAGSPFTFNVSPNFDDGEIWYVWVDYDGTTLEVRINQADAQPAQPVLTRDLDIPAILGQDTAFVGFTSGTGADWGNHDILTWEYDIFAPPCFGDFNGDQQVDGMDVGILLGAWDTDIGFFDLNGDNVVNGTDLGILLGAWGPCD